MGSQGSAQVSFESPASGRTHVSCRSKVVSASPEFVSDIPGRLHGSRYSRLGDGAEPLERGLGEPGAARHALTQGNVLWAQGTENCLWLKDGLKRLKFPDAEDNQEPKGGKARRALVQPCKLPTDRGRSKFQT